MRYSTVRYVASTTRNAVGPSVKDPRSGEIIESDVIWYHNHLRSYRNRYLLETGAANPKARTLDTPEEEIGEMMRRVIAHEVGHALGLPHNMKASSAYPVDSLRSGEFTQKMGIATTIMDYARYNYVAQPGDENIRFVRQIGPYDHYAIEWGYRYFDGADVSQVSQALKTMVDKKSLDPIYMFGGRGNDPNAQTENIGDDPVKATDYGLKNLKIVAKNLDAWTTPQGASFDDLEELYGELLGVYSRYLNHVAAIVGGVYETRSNQGQGAVPYRPVPAKDQRRALKFLEQELWNDPSWLMPSTLVNRFSQEGVLNRVTKIQSRILKRLLSVQRLNDMSSVAETLSTTPTNVGLTVDGLIDQLGDDLMALSGSAALNRNLQILWIHHLKELSQDKKLSPIVASLVSQALADTRSKVKSKRKRGSDIERAHFQYAYELLTQKE